MTTAHTLALNTWVDGNIWLVQLHSEVYYAEGPDGQQHPYLALKFESHREDHKGTNNHNWIGIVDWNGKHWKVEPEPLPKFGARVWFNFTE